MTALLADPSVQNYRNRFLKPTLWDRRSAPRMVAAFASYTESITTFPAESMTVTELVPQWTSILIYFFQVRLRHSHIESFIPAVL